MNEKQKAAASVVGRIWGAIAGPASLELKRGIFAGNFDQAAASKRGGKTNGAKNAESGHMDRIKTPESLAAGGRAACHKRHHIDGGKFQPKCALCQEGII
jgi:hypothetical protein